PRCGRADPDRPCVSLFALELDVFVGGRERVPGDHPDPRLLHPRPDAASSTMNGVMIPEVSAGSNHVGASEMCPAQVSCPSGAAAPGVAGRITVAKRRATIERPRTVLMV